MVCVTCGNTFFVTAYVLGLGEMVSNLLNPVPQR